MNVPADPQTAAQEQLRRRNRALLLALFAIFFGSLAIAGALRFSGWRPAGMKNRGELLDPPADVRQAAPRLLDGAAYDWNPAGRTWRVVIAPPADCGAECVQTARDVETVWELLGRDASRLDLLWLCPGTPCALPAGAPPLHNLRLVAPDSALRGHLPRVGETRHAGGRGVPLYVIDPNGFVILRYAAGSDPGDLRYDLSKLLKLK
jgi:hypothetical protein